MFLLLQRFVNAEFGNGVWEELQKETSGEAKKYNGHQNYPLSEMEAILNTASTKTGLTLAELMEKFGEKMVPDLMAAYSKYVNPEWKTFEVLEYTEHVMHRAVRIEESSADPPVLNVSRVHDKLLIIDYYSERKMGSLAVGIIKGIAAYFGEADKVKVHSNSSPNDARVQLRVEFE